jgi:hypothetical protein
MGMTRRGSGGPPSPMGASGWGREFGTTGGAGSIGKVAPAGGVSTDSTPSMGTGVLRGDGEGLPIDTASVSVSSWRAQEPLTS